MRNSCQQCPVCACVVIIILSISKIEGRERQTSVFIIFKELTSGNTEMLLFSRFSSSSSRHLANDLGMADNRLYLRPKRFMLARLPTERLLNVFNYGWGRYDGVERDKKTS